ncbi:MAG: ATP-binding cassette domain-containing protein [Chitinivibrionales bacterium]|nr:ATP-binding cassette domain-containing protein [Chitinivibrionales bacterium]
MPSTLEIVDLGYRTESGWALFENVQLTLNPGDLMIIAGRSGSGRSTLLELCAALTAPTRGCIRWDGEEVSGMPRARLFEHRRRMGFVFQVHALISNMTVFDNIALPLRHHTDLDESDIRTRVESRLRDLGMLNASVSYPEELSIREQKSAAFIRAFIMDPDLVFLDEPTAGLDDVSERELIDALNAIRRSRPITTLMITNESRIMQALGGAIAVLNAGRVTVHPPRSLQSADIVRLLEGAYEQTRCE